MHAWTRATNTPCQSWPLVSSHVANVNEHFLAVIYVVYEGHLIPLNPGIHPEE